MAALDFGMALARGMLPQAKEAQEDLINQAGGAGVFKTEDWWNKAVDKQIDEGYREVNRTAKDYLMPTGEYQREKTQTRFQSGRYFGAIAGGPSWFQPGPSYSMFGMPPQGRTLTSYSAPEGAVKQGGEFVTRDIPIFGTQREDFTAGELSDIESSSKAATKKLKAQTESSKAAQKRLRRGTGGLVGKARLPGSAPSTGLPELGSIGLGLTSDVFGAKSEL
jgi:hypothetical protein